MNAARWSSGQRHRYWRGRSWDRLLGRSHKTQCRQRLATAVTYLWNCVVQTLSPGDGPRHLAASTHFGVIPEHNDLSNGRLVIIVNGKSRFDL